MSNISQRNVLFIVSVVGALASLVMMGRLAGSVETKLDNVILAVSHKVAHDAEQDRAIHALERETAVTTSRLNAMSSKLSQKADNNVAKSPDIQDENTN